MTSSQLLLCLKKIGDRNKLMAMIHLTKAVSQEELRYSSLDKMIIINLFLTVETILLSLMVLLNSL